MLRQFSKRDYMTLCLRLNMLSCIVVSIYGWSGILRVHLGLFGTLLWSLLFCEIGGITLWTMVFQSCLLISFVRATIVQISWLIMGMVLRILSGGMFYPLLLSRIFLETGSGFQITVFLRSWVLFCFDVFFLRVQVWSPHLYNFFIS